MNSPYSDSRFTVELNLDASNDLMAAYLAYFPSMQGHRVTKAEQIFMYLLSDDPERNGIHLTEGLYHLVVSPLRVAYEIHPANQIVVVTSIGFFPV